MAAITLKTPRLTLRRPERADASRIALLVGDWKVASMLASVPWPYTLDDARSWLAACRFGLVEHGHEIFAIAIPGEGLIGVVGLHVREEGVELGYWLGEPYWGRGLASEAAKAVVDYGFAVFDLPAIRAGHFEENAASARVLGKLGFRYLDEAPRAKACRARGSEVPERAMELTQAEWRGRLRGARAGTPSEDGMRVLLPLADG
ncbi:MAG: GNAT family N-acetyltransferase [Alphaproteobacteria bacterium]|nr:GNAT family N-acetyltransferase [Alphaproteobacteria bacterium]